jgi:hypothetical protein
MDAWAAFLNPEVVRPKLIAAGLFLLGHEMLIDSIKRHPLEFFSNHWTKLLGAGDRVHLHRRLLLAKLNARLSVS